MAWQTPKTNWQAADVVSKDDFNRIEGNIQELQNTKETPVGAQAKANAAENNAKSHANGLVGSLSSLATTAKNNVVAAINEVYNWLNSTASTLTNHLSTNASTSQRGHVQLSTSTTSTSTTRAATSSAVREVRNMFNFTAGDNVFVRSEGGATTTSTSYAKVKEIRVFSAGTIRVKFTMGNHASPTGATGGNIPPGTVYARIYKNGSAVGIERSLASPDGNPVSFTEDISVQKGDLVQIYGKGRGLIQTNPKGGYYVGVTVSQVIFMTDQTFIGGQETYSR